MISEITDKQKAEKIVELRMMPTVGDAEIVEIAIFSTDEISHKVQVTTIDKNSNIFNFKTHSLAMEAAKNILIRIGL